MSMRYLREVWNGIGLYMTKTVHNRKRKNIKKVNHNATFL